MVASISTWNVPGTSKTSCYILLPLVWTSTHSPCVICNYSLWWPQNHLTKVRGHITKGPNKSGLNTTCWLVVWNHGILWLSIYWECHDPNWRAHIFQRGWLKPPTSNTSDCLLGSKVSTNVYMSSSQTQWINKKGTEGIDWAIDLVVAFMAFENHNLWLVRKCFVASFLWHQLPF